MVAEYLDEPDGGLLLRSSGEQRTSNFLLWRYVDSPFFGLVHVGGQPDSDRSRLNR